jgi:SecD/SecF fusion protein
VSDRRSHLILLGLILAALAGVVAIAMPGSPAHKPVRKGLDLQGGLEVVLKAHPPPGKVLSQPQLDRAVNIMQERINKLGVSEPIVTKQGKDEVVIELAGIHDPQKALDIIGKTAQLEFYDLERDLVSPSIDVQGNPFGSPSLYGLLARIQATAQKGKPSQWYLFDAKTKKLVAGPVPSPEKLIATAAKRAAKQGVTTPAPSKLKPGIALPGGFKLFATPEHTVVVNCPAKNGCIGANPATPALLYFYLFKYDPDKGIPEMTGNELKLSGTRQDFDPTTNEPIVSMQFTKKGAKIFHKITREEAIRGRTRSTFAGHDTFQHFAIVLDREMKSSPYIDFHQNPDGIEGSNGAQITGIGSIGEAKDLALVLQTGALPVNFSIAERTDVSATLGKDSLREAERAALVGLLIVALFLLLLYRFLGLVAVIGLGIYCAFLYAAIVLLGVTLTLPGFAGLILTIGVAADANVVVFERIKEEVRSGKSVRAAVAAGYAKGFRTILDANDVTCIAALVLVAVATAGVKGFALMLLIGTVISLVTAVAATRAMLGLLAGFRWFDRPRFMGAHGQQHGRWLQIDFMGRRYLWLAISATVVVISLVSLGTRGLNLGIDFKGGTQLTFKTHEAKPVEDVRSQVGRVVSAGAVVQGKGKSVSGNYTGWQVRTKSLSPDEQKTLTNDLESKVGAYATGAKNVSASFGRQIARSAILAIVFSLFLIVLYIAVRFDIKYAVPVIVALVHDIVITVGVYSLTGREVSTSTVAAVLTVLGYSIYDTIIIFDRIRENTALMRHAPFATIANISLWETIRRSLATTFITLLPVASLLVFGGATLKDFAFALLIGITSGAYSSIFIAAPLLTMWKEREPDYARRKTTEPQRGDGAAQAMLDEAEAAAASAPTPELVPVEAVERVTDSAKRERRRQRRRARPHGRAR